MVYRSYEHLPPITKTLFDTMRSKKIEFAAVAKRSGISIGAIQNWRAKRYRSPSLDSFIACLEAVGLELKVVPKE